MKYYEVDFTISPCSQDAQDILSAMTGEAGFETFEETATGLKGYVQQALFDEDALHGAIDAFPFDGVDITYSIQEAEDKDWNEQWEQEGFEPIIVGDGRLIIHDGRHLPEQLCTADTELATANTEPATANTEPATANTELATANTEPATANTEPATANTEQVTANTEQVTTIEIDAHLAFGTGTHETTRMICSMLLDMNLQEKKVLDCGCGTGILAICALKLGADSAVGYDIDGWSADNTRHNAVINQVDDRITTLCGDASVLDGFVSSSPTAKASASVPGFNLVMANINRNILLQDMDRFRNVMAPKANLILSGFYIKDCALLESKAQTLGLSLKATRTDGDWACLLFSLD